MDASKSRAVPEGKSTRVVAEETERAAAVVVVVGEVTQPPLRMRAPEEVVARPGCRT